MGSKVALGELVHALAWCCGSGIVKRTTQVHEKSPDFLWFVPLSLIKTTQVHEKSPDFLWFVPLSMISQSDKSGVKSLEWTLPGIEIPFSWMENTQLLRAGWGSILGYSPRIQSPSGTRRLKRSTIKVELSQGAQIVRELDLAMCVSPSSNGSKMRSLWTNQMKS